MNDWQDIDGLWSMTEEGVQAKHPVGTKTMVFPIFSQALQQHSFSIVNSKWLYRQSFVGLQASYPILIARMGLSKIFASTLTITKKEKLSRNSTSVKRFNSYRKLPLKFKLHGGLNNDHIQVMLFKNTVHWN